jgi:hypothetical protein
LTPNIGAAFGGDADTSFTWGASFAWMPAGIVGAELDLQFTGMGTPDTLLSDFGFDTDVFDSSARSVMGNVIVGIPFGGTTGVSFRPYAVAGLGWMTLNLSDNLENIDLLPDDQRAVAIDVGGGIAGFFTDNIGVRGDIRWYRGFVDDDNIVIPELDDFRNTEFWRATGGVTFRFSVSSRVTSLVSSAVASITLLLGQVTPLRVDGRASGFVQVARPSITQR